MAFLEGLVKLLAFHRYEAASAQPLSQVSYDLQIQLWQLVPWHDLHGGPRQVAGLPSL
jgi:hypothetical protein